MSEMASTNRIEIDTDSCFDSCLNPNQAAVGVRHFLSANSRKQCPITSFSTPHLNISHPGYMHILSFGLPFFFTASTTS
jgi:hypothetical protein